MTLSRRRTSDGLRSKFVDSGDSSLPELTVGAFTSEALFVENERSKFFGRCSNWDKLASCIQRVAFKDGPFCPTSLPSSSMY